MKKKAKIIIIGILALSFGASILYAGNSDIISHQGRLLDEAGALLDGQFRMQFLIYDNSTSGALLWSETYFSVTVTNGLYNVFLGANNPFPDSLDFTKEYWLEVLVNGDALERRIEFSTSPYAFITKRIANILHINSGYHLGGDTVVVGDDTIAVPRTGDTFIDTSSGGVEPPPDEKKTQGPGDILEIYLNGNWELFFPIR